MIASLTRPIWLRLKRNWMSIALVAIVLLSLASSLGEARWCSDCFPFAANTLLGALYGVALASSRFHGRTAAAHNLLMSIAVTIVVIGRILPAPQVWSYVPVTQSLWIMNLRILSLFDQIGRGVLTNVLIGWLVWNASVWLIWCVARRREALPGLLPFAAMLALNTLMNGRDTNLPLDFIACAVLLLARTHFTGTIHDWNRRRVGYPDLIAEYWVISTVTIGVVVVALAWFSTPGFQRSLNDLLAALRQPPPGAGDRPGSQSTLIETAPNVQIPDLELIGGPLSESEATVMWVQVSDPPPTLNEQGLTVAPARTHYWRSAVFSEYDGTGWKLAVAGENEFTFEPPATAPPGRYTLRQEYEIVAQHADDLFAVNTPVTATEGAAVRWLAPNGDAVLRGTPSTYAVTSWATNVAASQLISDSTDYPAEIRNTYLQLPDTLPARVRDLADRVTSGAGTPYDKAIRLQDYLRLAYPYRLDVPPPPPGVDAVDYFLFDAPGGFCTYYASAMVVMLRMEGVPARVAAGFAMGEYDSSRQAYRVPASSMHAWVEVYFPDYGWIEFEPTAAQAVFDYRAADTSVVAPPPAPPSATSSVPTALSLVFLAAALIGVYVLARVAIGYVPLFSLGRHDHGKQSHTLYWQVRKDLSRIGFGARANVTPGEFLSASAGRLAERKRLRDALQAITALYIKATFTSNPPTKADVQTSRTMWRQAWRDRLGLRLRMMSARALKR